MLTDTHAPKMFGFTKDGGYWMEQRAVKASKKLSRAIGGIKRSKNQDRPVNFNGKGVLFGDAIFRDSFFNIHQKHDRRSVKRWHHEQPWLKWDTKTKSFTFQKEGATDHLLSKLGASIVVHRGASALEASFWRGVKKYHSGTMSPGDAVALTGTLKTIAETWELKPASTSRLRRMVKAAFSGPVPTTKKRRDTTLFLLDLIAQRVEDGDGYGTVSATPSLKAARGWAKGTEKGSLWGRKKQHAEVLSFAFEPAKMPPKAHSGLYAGIEDGTFLKLPAYVEVAFVTPEAKLFALKHLTTKPATKHAAK
ncbi:MAG: hypothetical protein KAI47_00115 [Deltaproteobacteria bacterium]|nr:hypothetical protein [Deltaproteobacteria bacterium]